MHSALSRQAELPLIQRINRFLASPYFIFSVVFATMLSNFFGWELMVYTAYVLVALYACFVGKDLLPLIPLVACGYLSPSVNNNPGKNPASVFTSGNGAEYVLTLALVLLVGLCWFVIRNRKQFFSCKRRLLWGLVLVAVAYCCSGLLSPAYPQLAGKNLRFAAIQALTLVLPYVLITGGVRWEAAPRDYFGWTGFGAGCLLIAQLVWIYLTGDVIQNGAIVRLQIFTGWGMHNNLGGMLSMMLPFAFYLGVRYQKGWLGMVFGAVFLVGVVMSCSRSAILVGFGMYALCMILCLRYTGFDKGNVLTLVSMAAVATAVVLIFRQPLFRLFENLIHMGINPSYRDVTWAEGIKQFVKYPIFGGSFYPIDFSPWDFSEVSGFSSFFPPRWHNTVIQLLACTGTVGMVAYSFHRVQSVWLLVRDANREKVFIGCAVLALLGTSLLDCHMFNIGPVLVYTMGLAFAEKCCQTHPL